MNTKTNSFTFWCKKQKWIDKTWIIVIYYISISLLALIGLLVNFENLKECIKEIQNYLIVSSIILTIFIIFISIVTYIHNNQQRIEYEELKEKYEYQSGIFNEYQSGIQENIDSILIDLSNNLCFGNTERISIYKHQGNYFINFARHSKNIEYRRKTDRLFPINIGIIGVAYKNQNGTHEDHDFPDKNVDEKGYIKRHAEIYKINKDNAKNFKMPSRSYIAICIQNKHKNINTAVILFESTVQNKFKDRLDNIKGHLNEIEDFVANYVKFEILPNGGNNNV